MFKPNELQFEEGHQLEHVQNVNRNVPSNVNRRLMCLHVLSLGFGNKSSCVSSPF